MLPPGEQTKNPNRRQALAIADFDARDLADELRRSIDGEVRFDEGSRALYATDASNYRQVPIGVVVPKSLEDVLQTVALCRRFGSPVLTRGGGTSLAGQCCNVAVVLDMSKFLHRVLEVDPERRIARVEPGTILDDLRARAETHGLTFGPDPATHAYCTLGGMIGNDSCGVHSVMAAFEGEGGKTSDNVEELEILTYDGLRLRVGKTSEQELTRILTGGGRRREIYAALKALRDKYADKIREKYPKIPRRVSGYNLSALLPENGFHLARALVGSEGTCVVVLEATLQLIPSPPARSLLVLGFSDVYTAADHVPEILERRPTGLEGIDEGLVSDMRRVGLHPDNLALLPEGAGWLLVEFGGTTHAEADAKARQLMADLRNEKNGPPSMRLFDRHEEQKKVWEVRESGLAATAHVPASPLTWEGWEDSAVPPERLGNYMRDLRKLFAKYGYHGDFYGHFGQGCLHTRINFDLETSAGLGTYRSFVEEAADLVVSYGGSLSGEHGDGQSRAELLPKMFGPELVQAFREFKAIWDPEGKMNPGKVVDAYALDQNLRLGADYRPWRPQTHFRFPDDEGDFSRAMLRCVGVGKCRRLEGGTMCPSFMVTREEQHSTRGRAHLLFEMLKGEPLQERWREESVRQALDLCLACKGCKGDCPVNVDMATYKAEFLSHYYKGRLRPRSAYAFGLIAWWSRLASLAPDVANVLTHAPMLGGLAKLLAGVTPEREIPPFARETFRAWFRGRGAVQDGRPRVILWPDTFNNHFHPETAKAAVTVFEAAGYAVTLPSKPLCCGRPLYDYGMLDLAKRSLRSILRTLRSEIQEGIPMVVLEPSCAAVFRDEMPNLFPFDEGARRLKEQTFLLSEFLETKAPGWTPPHVGRKAIVQDHCHHKAVMRVRDQHSLLKKMGLEFETPNDTCCGMAGAFGFEKDHYELSILIGERALAPAVRQASPDTLIIAGGFSCREQIRHMTGRKALHLAQVLEQGIRGVGAEHGSKRPGLAT